MITDEQVSSLIQHTHYQRIGQKTTLCLLITSSGFEVLGSSVCATLLDYSYDLGKKYAFGDAFEKLRSFVAFREAEPRYL